MTSSEIYRMLSRRARRGAIICSALWIASFAAIVWASVTAGGQPWVVAALLASILLYLAFNHVRKGKFLAWSVSEKPQIVYWAQHNAVTERFSPDVIDFKSVTLHLRTGQQLEVHLGTAEMRDFITWLLDRNPSIRLGQYDCGDSSKT
jgi:hypothetical protein